MADGITLQTVSGEVTCLCRTSMDCLPFPSLDVGFEVPNKFVVGYALVCVCVYVRVCAFEHALYVVGYSCVSYQSFTLPSLQDYNEYFRDLNVSVQ